MAFIKWETLKNPIFSRLDQNWCIKDACACFREGVFYLFFSAFYEDRGRIRCHVAGVTTRDWHTYSEPILLLDGQEAGWTGIASPNITETPSGYILTFNSWGDTHPNKRTNSLFYIQSADLVHWSAPLEVARNLTEGIRAIDIAVARVDDGWILAYKDRKGWRKLFCGLRDRTRIAWSSDLDGAFSFIGRGYGSFTLQDKTRSKRTHENFEFLRIDGIWYLLSTDYTPHRAFLYKMGGSGTGSPRKEWLSWVEGRELVVPREAFNTAHLSNAAFLADWREYDGFFYLLYAGNTENRSFARRGNNQLGLARSRDLVNWDAPKAA